MNLNFDLQALLWLNATAMGSDATRHLVQGLGNNPILRGLPVLYCLLTIWFSADGRQRRAQMLVGLGATALAVGLSVWGQYHLNVHLRPSLDPALPGIVKPRDLILWDRLGSFPSDTATLFFALAAVVLRQSRLAGMLCLVWVAVTAGVCRVAMAYHYPSDIAGAFVLGVGTVWALSASDLACTQLQRLLDALRTKEAALHATLLIFLADAYHLFPGLQGLAYALLKRSVH